MKKYIFKKKLMDLSMADTIAYLKREEIIEEVKDNICNHPVGYCKDGYDICGKCGEKVGGGGLSNTLCNDCFDGDHIQCTRGDCQCECRTSWERKEEACGPDTSGYFEIIDTPDRKTSELLDECRSLFRVWTYYNDTEMDKDFLPPKEATRRYFKKTIESDENLKDKSAVDLEKEGIKGITIRERIIMELKYFKETGKHLDIENWTLCSGSRNSGGRVPYAYWSDDGFFVYWSYRDYRRSSLRSREAVSLAPPISKDFCWFIIGPRPSSEV